MDIFVHVQDDGKRRKIRLTEKEVEEAVQSYFDLCNADPQDFIFGVFITRNGKRWQLSRKQLKRIAEHTSPDFLYSRNVHLVNDLMVRGTLNDTAILELMSKAIQDYTNGSIAEARDALRKVVDAIDQFENEYSM